jgi:Lar family restriction alleviation protein
MTDTVTLKPCPFCGGNDVTPVCVYHPNGYAIGCPKCRAKGPTYKASRASDLPADAITAWNTRDGGAATPMRETASSVEAADLLDRYAAFIRTVKADDLELHPYLPEVERIAAELRSKAGAPS